MEYIGRLDSQIASFDDKLHTHTELVRQKLKVLDGWAQTIKQNQAKIDKNTHFINKNQKAFEEFKNDDVF